MRVMAAAGSQGCKSSQETLSNEMHCFEEETVGRKQSFGYPLQAPDARRKEIDDAAHVIDRAPARSPSSMNSHNVSSSVGSVGGDGISQPFIRRQT
jgi:hypothetical protein